MKNKINREIQVLARYIGCKCDIDYASNVLQKNVEFSISKISDYSKGYIRKLTLRLKPVSELTQEDYERMNKDLTNEVFSLEDQCYLVPGLMQTLIEEAEEGALFYYQADWLRSNGYYLGEPEIKKFVKTTLL